MKKLLILLAALLCLSACNQDPVEPPQDACYDCTPWIPFPPDSTEAD